ncbi:AraC family transcriptional regulator, partial [Pseudomonas syringae]|uniref:AraC family transcriptional regulator n=1 Tax=Pseudomonas syringae TaxID=317 RepID=UPI0034D743CB
MAELLQVFSPWQSLTEASDITPSLRRAREYLHDHNTQEVRLDMLAREVGISKFHLCRQFSAKFGLSPSRYQRQLR